MHWFKLALNLNYRVRKLTEASGGDRCVHNKLDRTVLTTKRLKLDGIVKKSKTKNRNNNKNKNKKNGGRGSGTGRNCPKSDGDDQNWTVASKTGRKVGSLK